MNKAQKLALPIVALMIAAMLAEDACAYVLPYTTRTRDYSAWTPATQGDTNTIGMAGATVALPTSVSSAQFNPAGYAMMTASISAQINSTNFTDERLQRSGEPLASRQWGFGVSPEHWGFSLGYYSPQAETGTYVAPAVGDAVKTEVSLKELRFVVARAFLEDRVSVGVGFELAKAVRELDDTAANAYGASFQLGTLVRFDKHIIFGASFSPELEVGPAAHPDAQVAIPGFNRAVVRPALVTLGAGWIPNRFFKVGVSATYVGGTANTALLYDQNVLTGQSPAYVPRLGVSYVLAEYSNFKIEAAAGGYYEWSRLSNQSDRLHATAGVDINPSFINLGAGFDIAAGYHAYIVSAGVDIVRTARFFKIIPEEPTPPYKGVFPNILHISPEGLPSGVTADEPKRTEEQSVSDVGKIISEVPENLQKKLEGKKTTVEVKEKAKGTKPSGEKAQPGPGNVFPQKGN